MRRSISADPSAGRLLTNVSYVPARGDIIWLDFDPRAGHEQAGTRPALVVSPSAYNQRSGLALVCPITSSVKGYPFEAAIPPGIAFSGVVLSDQVRSADWRARIARFVTVAPADLLSDVMAKLHTLTD